MLRKREPRVLYEGDIVYLHFQGDGYAHSDGFVDERLGCLRADHARAATFEGCLFRVVPKLTYEAAKALHKIKDEALDKVELLKQQAAAETEANAAVIRHLESSGQGIVYGQIVQLQHVLSGKFLTSKAKTLADVDKTSMKVTLQADGSMKAYFTLLPRYKTRSVGSSVIFHDSVCLARAKYTSHVLHLSAAPYPRDALDRKEINMNYKESILQLQKYTECTPPSSRSLQIGKLYRLFHLEGQAYVTFSANPYATKAPYLRQIVPDSNYAASANFTLKSLYVLERLDPKEGGVVTDFDDEYRFRHLATGQYLALSEDGRHHEVPLVGARADEGHSTFCLRPTFGSLGSGNSTQLTFRIETPHHGEGGPYRLHNPNRAKANHALKHKASYHFVASTRLLDEDCFRLVEASATEAYEAFYLSSVVQHLRRYRDDVQLALQKRVPVTHMFLTNTLTALRSLIAFLQAGGSAEDADGRPIFHRQEQVREAKVLDTLYEMLRVVKTNHISTHDLATDPSLKVVLRVHRLINKVLVCAVNGNLANKNYIATRSATAYYYTVSKANEATPGTYMDETLGHIGSETGSKSVYRSLFLNNKQLLEHSVDLSLITSSCRNIEAKGVKAFGILHFLSTICACDDVNLPQNQELIVRALYSLTLRPELQTTRYSILIEAAACPNPVRPVSPAVKDFVVSAPSGASSFAHNGHPVGYDMLSKGYVNIVVSWKAALNWDLNGSSGLFFTPAELQLTPVVDAAVSSDLAQYDQLVNAAHREWILLEHIVWTLQPDDMFPLLFNGKVWATEWAEIQRDHERLEVFERLKALANYYNLQLMLFAELLRGHCATSLEILSAQFSYNMLLSAVANPGLPHTIRTSFSTMLHLCWLRRFPHEPLLLPRYVYGFDDIPKLDRQAPLLLAHFELQPGHPALASDDAFIAYPFADKFAFVQGVVHETMLLMAKDKLVLSTIDANVCLSALLVIVDWLVRCGFYPDMEAIERLLMPLLLLLDGRNTVYSPSALALVNSSQATFDDTTRYNRNKLNDALTKCKMQICDILQAINVVWRNYEVLSLLSHFKYVGFQDITTPTAANDDIDDNDDDDGDHAASPDDVPRRRPRAKKKIGKRQKDESARLLAPPKKHSTFLQLFAKGSLDMRSIAKLPLATICMDLMMYEDDTLVHAALALMLQLHTRQDQVLSYLGQCILVRPSVASARIASSSISSAQVLKEMEYMGPLLRHYMTSFASPSLCDQMLDVNKVPLGYAGVAHLLVDILRKMQEFCVDKLNGSELREPNLEKQTILLQLHTHLDVMELLRMPTTLIEPKYKANLMAVKAECCLFFQRLMARNPMGQRLVFPCLPDLIARFEELQNIGDVLIAIFVDNRDLCSSIPEEAIWTTMKLLNDLLAQLAAGADDGFSTICTILNFFTHYMIPDQVPMKSNQVHLFSVLSHPQFEHTILPFGRGIEPNMEVGSVDLMTTDGYLSLLDLVRNPNASAQLVYFEKSLELLGCVCRGKTYKTEVECQQLYPLNFILTLLLDEEMPLTLKVVAGKFLAEVFLDTDLDVDPKIGVLPAMWSVLLHCSTQIAAYNAFLYKDQAPSSAESTPKANITFDELARYVFEGNLSIVTAFFSCVYNPKADDLDDNTVHIVHALRSDIKSLKKRGKLDVAQHEICDYCGIALGLPIEKKPTLPPLRRTPSNTSIRHRNAIVKHRPNATLVETVATASSFDQFKWSLLEAPDICASVHAELQEFVDVMETIEALTDKSRPDAGADRANTITKQLLASRIMKFIADNPTSSCVVSTLEMLVRTISSKALSEDAKLRLQRAEIEEAQEMYQTTQTFMATCGAARLVLTLIANAYNPGTMLKAIEFGLSLVRGGNATVQAMLYESMQASDERFFMQIDRILQAAIEKVKETRRTIKYIAESRLAVSTPSTGHGAAECSRATDNLLAFTHSDADVVISGDLLIHFLSMLAEGHNLQMQLVMLDQSHVGNLMSVNLLQTVTSYLAILVKDEAQLQNMSADDCRSLNACWLFLTEYMQGPCSAIQEYLTGSVMVEIFRKTLKAHINVVDASDDTLPTADAVKTLKANAVKTMVSLLEGRSDDRVEARLRSTLELKAIKNRLLELYEQYHAEKEEHNGDMAWHEEFLDEGVNLFTLAQCVFRPSSDTKADDDTLVPESTKTSKAPRRGDYASEAAFKAAKADWRHKSMYAKAYKFFDDLHCTIEIWWGTDEPRLDTVHFPLHSHCRMFAFLGHKKERLLNDFDYKSNERLKQFVQAARGLDEEMQHIEMLSRFLLYNLIRPYIPLFKSLSFILAIFMNLIMLVALKHNDESTDRHFEPNGLQQPMQYFGMLQIFLSTAVLVFMLVISVPLVFRARRNAQIKNLLDSYNASKKQRKLESLEFDLADLKAIHLQIDEVGKHLKSGLLGLTSTAKGLVESLVQIYHSYLPLLRMILLIYLLQLTLLQAFPDFPTEVPFIILFLPFVRNTRNYLETSCSWFGLVYTLVYDVIFDKHTAFYTVYLGTACCATMYHPIFYGYHLLDLVIMSPSLQNVVRAVTKPGRALALTCLLGLFVIYFYTMVLFFFTPSDATDEVEHVPYCSTMMDCFLFFVHRGLLSGGGIGDFLTNGLNHPPNYFNRSMYWARVFFDLSFFVLVIVLLLNIVFGITIDTFGELRTEANEKERLMKNQCFICGLSRDVFENHYTEQGISDGFAKHIASEHNMWNYLYFIVHLRAKDLTDCTGPEAYVKTLLEKDDHSWFPQGMAQCLTRANVASTERDLSDIKGQLKALSAQMEHIASVATESA
ncbi:hypothetical protein SDRG_06915 [Saprolegnia diclina VS20]|uniref:MIR domain-containing protein n=1 Tax=Saprolegnia diclina (strain VS20) TaxID=1156394 RepID=T0QLN2_SAPDV|nr:hypothetical protein SDRG_06915 [Saprolegnia diclina VS20]EQC35631.1 hypothetical protein SDRG_06915 [Saprolegnia diclina VS20]|eukprot:XP_008610948.1 hypothetical protein SDRG_06915 [Saprolegnia diclina VS20]